ERPRMHQAASVAALFFGSRNRNGRVTRTEMRWSKLMLVQVEHLTKTFDGFKAVDDVSFSIRRGEILGLLGPNGAGKTTTIQMVLGLITPSAGEIRIFGK